MDRTRIETVVRAYLRSFADGSDVEFPSDLTGMTQAEADEAWAEIGLRVTAAVCEMRARIVATAPHLTEADLAVVDRLLQETLAPLENPPFGPG
jgi:hypothetical protein